ncbi:MAG TPA: family 43 glycosylhydrolase [Candidatus Udaeobacter sp.]|jgi:hypothetical protein|nr:family 43 glycosylhydrolase [Candidatus Udaeobacter sp.]
MAAHGRHRGLTSGAARLAPALALALAVIAARVEPAQATIMKPPLPYRAKECAFVWDGGQFHVFYIRDNINAPFDSTERDFGHAVSYDLVHWSDLDPILPIRPSSWDNFHVWSPTIVHKDSLWYLFYAGVTYVPDAVNRRQSIGLATSPDLMSWTRLDQPILGCAEIPWAYCDSSSANGGDFRDPFVMEDPATPGSWLMYVCTRPDAARDEMVLGLSESSGDLTQWTDRMPMWNTDPFHSFSPLIESPAMIDHDGLWYLFYDTNSSHTINYETSTDPAADSTGWSNQRHLSSEITSEDTDAWFGPEFLRVGGHDYFCAVNSDNFGLEFREIVWGEPGHFQLIEPSTQGLDAPREGGAPDLTLRVRRAGRAWHFEIASREAAPARLDLIDVAGRRVASLLDGEVTAGITARDWNGTDAAGRRVGAGVFFARLASRDRVRIARLVVTH